MGLAARMVMNPQSLRSSAFEVTGDYSEQWTAAQPVGLTLPEQLVLARYRKRTA